MSHHVRPSRSRTVRSTAQAGFFCVSGLPDGVGWQQWKDWLRSHLVNEPGWVDVVANVGGTAGHSGFFSVKTDDDADRAFALLTTRPLHGRWLIVHRFNDATQPPELVACNCQAMYPGTVGHLSGTSADGPAVTQLLLSHPPVVPMFSAPVYHSQQQAPPAYRHASPAGQLAAPAASFYPDYTCAGVYPLSTSATLTQDPNSNAQSQQPTCSQIRSGASRHDTRGIVIKGLPPSTKREDLEGLLRSVGSPVKFDLSAETGSGKAKEHAIALFPSRQEAEAAAKQLNGTAFMGKNISVCLDEKNTAVEPLVVNGSLQSRRQ